MTPGQSDPGTPVSSPTGSTTTPPGPGPARGSIRMLLAACLVGGSAGWAMTSVGAVAATTATAYGRDLVWVGLLTASLAAPYAALQYPAGVLVDRLGARRAAATGLSVVVAAHLLVLLAPLAWLALVVRLVSGAGFAVCFVCGAELARRSGRGAWGMGVFGGLALAASGGAVLVVPFTELLVGWRAPWLTTLAAALLALGSLVGLPGASSPRVAAGEPAVRVVPRPHLVRDGQLLRLSGVHAVTLGLGLVLSSWATTLLVEIWRFGAAAAAVVGSCVLGLSVVSRPLGGRLAQHWPHRTRLVWVVTLALCSAGTLALARPTWPVVAVAGVVVIGLVSGLPFASVVGAAQDRQPGRSAAAVGVMNTMAFGLVVAATPLVGWAVEHGMAAGAVLVVGVLWLVPLALLPGVAAQPDRSPAS